MKFEIGKTYFTRSACDYDCVITLTIVSRTEHTIKATDKFGELKSFRVNRWDDGTENVKPWGRGSMMPIIDATKAVVEDDTPEPVEMLEPVETVKPFAVSYSGRA